MAITTLEQIRHNGKIIEVGETVRLGDKVEKRLVHLGAAEYVPDPNTVDNDIKDVDIDSDVYEKLAEQLDDTFNRDPLASKASEHNVEFERNARKDEIIDAIITQGKAEDILDVDLSDDQDGSDEDDTDQDDEDGDN